jgi:HK97 family phage major capsid protein
MSKRIEALIEKRDALKATLDGYDNDVIERGSDLDETEQTNYDESAKELDVVVRSLEDLSKREALITASRNLAPATGPAKNGSASESDDATLYRGYEHNAITDVLNRSTDGDAADRIRRHNKATIKGPVLLRAASATSDLGGLVVPAYLTEDFAPIAREHRPLVDAIGVRPLTNYQVVISKATTGFSVGVPTAQNTAYSTAAPATTPITLTAQTIGGYADLSREAVNFGAYDQNTLFQDIFESYWRELDYRLYHGTDSNGQWEGILLADGINTQDGTNVDTYAELYAAVVESASKVRTAIKAPATHVIMSSARWYSLLAETDSEGRPVMGFNGSVPQNVGGQFDALTFAGLKVVVDDNIVPDAGTDTRVIVARLPEYRLYATNGGNPEVVRLDEVVRHAGSVRFVGDGYAAFTAERRPGATTLISSLPVPTFPAAQS